ncbi:polysaccharide deacetylase family protein, partial [uncultured Thiodictyon sp.]|uniref:polysaccharide deacetylase family protein n=1 Tax=uncultured Thiodictyon sp. TaxID=1846217 RepID=UPI0025F788A5
ASGLIELGAHTVSHPLLTDLPHDAARTEMRVSKERLEALGGRPVTHFAYPFGKRDCATPALRTLARECGFSSAVLAYGGPVYPDSNRYALPRLPFGDEDSLAALRLRASGARSLFARHPHSEHSSGESNA